MIPISLVKNRYKAVNEQQSTSGHINSKGLMSGLSKYYNYGNICLLAENFKDISGDDSYSMNYLCDKLEECCVKDSEANAKKLTKIIANEAAIKFRSADQLKQLFSRRKAALKHKVVGAINKSISTAKQAVGMAGNIVNGSSRVVNKHTKLVKQKQDIEKKKAKLAEECYSELIETANLYRSCDRVWQTHEKINRRFNTNKIFYENFYDTENCVNEFCTLLDTYDVPFRAKFNICLENVMYEYSKNNKNIDKEKLASYITEYFIYSGSIYGDQTIEEETRTDNLLRTVIKNATRLSKNSNMAVSSIGNAVLSVCKGAVEVTKSLAIALGNIVGKLIGGLLIAVGVATIGAGVISLIISVILGVILICMGAGIAYHLSDDIRTKVDMCETKKNKEKIAKLKKALDQWQKDKKKADKKFSDSVKDIKESYCELIYDSNMDDIKHILNTNSFYDKDNVQEALSLLDNSVDQYFTEYTEMDHVFGIQESILPKNSKGKDFIKSIRTSANKSPEFIKQKIKELFTHDPKSIIDGTPEIFKTIFWVVVLGGSIAIHPFLGLLTFMVTTALGIRWTRELYAKYIKKWESEIARAEKKGKNLKGDAKERNEAYVKKLKSELDKLKDHEDKYYTEKENDERKGYSVNSDSNDDELDLKLDEQVFFDVNGVINEMSISNQLTMLIDSVKRGAQNLSDKEKIASRTLDTSLENLRTSMTNALKHENREAVIRGQVIPPASRIIKLAIVSGFTFLIHPALTVIYLLGVFALSKNLRSKERQIVYDELDTELKVCKEYIEKAKENKDMNAYRNCLNIEKKLLRQRDRLKYKMDTKYNESLPSSVEGQSYNKD